VELSLVKQKQDVQDWLHSGSQQFNALRIKSICVLSIFLVFLIKYM
jgi:hypothetical protein